MKKILVVFLVLAFVIAALPFVGNKLAKETINQRIELLTSYGMEVIETGSESSYLETNTHYKLKIEDEKKFITYLQQFSDEQLPPYINAMLKGVTIGTDIKYSNIPISDDISVDIYPLTLSSEMMQEIEKEDAKLSMYIENFLASKGALYHINYNIVRSDFDGYIKDIDEEYTLEDKSLVKLKLSNAIYSGSGPIVAPTSLISNIDTILLSLSKEDEKLTMNLSNFSTSSNFESQSTYLSDAKLKDFSFEMLTQGQTILANAKEWSMNISSNTQGEKAQMYAKSKLQKFDFHTDKLDINASNFNYDISLRDVDKDTLEEFRILLSNANSNVTPQVAEDMQRVATKLLSKGLSVDIADFSIEDIILNKTQNLEGFKIKLNLLLNPDAALAQNIETNPMAVADSVDIKIHLKISKPIFAMISQLSPMAFVAKGYAKEEANSLIYDVALIKGELKVNGQALQ